MNSKNIFSINNQSLFKILLTLNILLSISCSSFIAPTAITLGNGNIFVIHQTGITICDSDNLEIIKNVYTFSSEEQIIYQSDLAKITISKFSNNYIICFINNNVYIFDMNGEFKAKGGDIFTSSPSGLYFSLSPHTITENRYYNYLLAFILNSELYLRYYYYDSVRNEIKLNFTQTESYRVYYENSNDYEEYYITNKGINCQFGNFNSKEIITCLFYRDSGSSKRISISTYYINRNSFSVYNDLRPRYLVWDDVEQLEKTFLNLYFVYIKLMVNLTV